MQLYEKITSPNGRVSYREHTPAAPDLLADQQVDTEQVVTLLTTLTISMLMSISGQLLPHMKLTREVKELEQAVLRFAKLNCAKLDPALVDVGVRSWNAAIKAMQEGLLVLGDKP